MGASSVTGVSGVGSAEKLGMKGPGNGRNQYVPLVSPHVVAAGSVTCSSNVATVVFPTPLAKAASNYVVMLTSFDASGANASEVVVTAKTDVSGVFASFAVAATDAAQVVEWVVFTKGVA